MEEKRRRYHFSPQERSGDFFGFRGGQLVVGGSGLALATGVFQLASELRMFLLGLGLLAVSIVVTFGRWRHRGLDQWVPLLTSWAWRRLSGGHRWRSRAAAAGGDARGGARELSLPPQLRGVKILESAPLEGGRRFGVIKDGATGTYLAVLQARGGDFPMADRIEQERLLGLWGQLMTGIGRAGAPIRAVQWIEGTYPDAAETVGGDLRERIVLPPESPQVQSYLAVIDDAAPSTLLHEVYLVVQLDDKRARKAIKQRGGGDAGACSVLDEQLRYIAGEVTNLGVEVQGVLPARLVAKLFRDAADPKGRGERDRRGVLQAASAGVEPNGYGPHATEEHWGHYVTDSGVHATWWISEWPLSDVGPNFLAPLALNVAVRRRIAVIQKPVDPDKAARELSRRQLEHETNRRLRGRYGFGSGARSQREERDLQRRDEQLSNGAMEYRYSGYITATADSLDQLEADASRIDQAAHRAHLELMRLYGEQATGWQTTLPLCRGLR